MQVIFLFLFTFVGSNDLKTLDQWMQSLVDSKRVIGCMAQITQNGNTMFLKSHGKRSPESDEKLNTDQIIKIYSMTKSITSVGVMQLVEQKKIGLDDKLSKYIPEFSQSKVLKEGIAISPRREITIRDLLRHTSGLPYAFTAPPELMLTYTVETNNQKTLQEFAKKVSALPLAEHPGTEFIYGLSTDILGRVIEVVSKKPLGIYLKENIFDPLSMTDTSFIKKKNLKEMPLVKRDGNSLKIDDLYYTTSQGTLANPFFPSGGGGLWSTIHDYTNFCIALEQGGELKGHRILNPETVSFMTQNQLDPGIGTSKDPLVSKFGLGFNIHDPVQTSSGLKGANRWGWCGAASTFFFIDPSQNLTAVFGTQLFPDDINNYIEMYNQFHIAVLESIAENN